MSLPTPYWEDASRGLVVYHADCRELLPLFETGSFGSAITDCPYGIGIADWDIPPDSAILQECLRVAMGTVVMFGGSPIVSLSAFFDLNPRPERMLVWNPSFTLSHMTANGMYYHWHPVWCWRLPKKQGEFFDDVLGRPTNRHKSWMRHEGAKPELLMRDLCRAFGGTSVLDPYCGSGTTLAACAKLRLPCTGVELEERYCEMTARRLEEDLTYGESNLFNQEPSHA